MHRRHKLVHPSPNKYIYFSTDEEKTNHRKYLQTHFLSLLNSKPLRFILVYNHTDVSVENIFRYVAKQKHANFKFVNTYFVSRTLKAFQKIINPRFSDSPIFGNFLVYIDAIEVLNKRPGWTEELVKFSSSVYHNVTIIGTVRDPELLDYRILSTAEEKVVIISDHGLFYAYYVKDFISI